MRAANAQMQPYIHHWQPMAAAAAAAAAASAAAAAGVRVRVVCMWMSVCLCVCACREGGGDRVGDSGQGGWQHDR